MAHNFEWSKRDLEATQRVLKPWLQSWKTTTKPKKTLDVCGGFGRNWEVYREYSQIVDLHDINPAWIDIPKQHRGEKFKCDLKDLLPEMNKSPKRYNLIFVCWGFCYASLETALNLLHLFKQALAFDGRLIIKEEILREGNKYAHFDKHKHQQFLYRPLEVLRVVFEKFFTVLNEGKVIAERNDEVQNEEKVDTYLWCLEH